MAANGTDIRRLAADMAARGQVQKSGKAGGMPAIGWARIAAFTMPVLILAVLALTATLAVSVVKTGGFLGLGGWTALGMVSLVGAILINTVWLRTPRFDGFRVTKSSAPELFSLIAEAARELRCGKPESIVVTDTLAVRLHQTPRFGLLGGSAGMLEIGLPAIQTYSRTELAVFIAQELARFGAGRNRSERLIERMADLWAGAMRPAARPSLPIDFIAGAFGAWIAPRLNAAARPARAAGVLLGDQASADLVSPAETALALQRKAIAVAFLDEYWHRLAEEPITTPTPSFLPYREMADFMPRIGEWEQCEAALRLALVNRPMAAGAEPSLAQRLKALGMRPAMPTQVFDPATELLGTAYDAAITRFDQQWQKANAKAWAKAYAEQEQGMAAPSALGYGSFSAVPLAAEYAAAISAEASGSDFATECAPTVLPDSTSMPSIEDALELARGAEIDDGFDAARDHYVNACEWYPDNGRIWLNYAAALVRAQSEDALECIEHTLGLTETTQWESDDGQFWFDIGKVMLEQGEPGGIVCLEQAIAIDSALTDEAMLLADGFADQEAPVEAAYAEPPFATDHTVATVGADGMQRPIAAA